MTTMHTHPAYDPRLDDWHHDPNIGGEALDFRALGRAIAAEIRREGNPCRMSAADRETEAQAVAAVINADRDALARAEGWEVRE